MFDEIRELTLQLYLPLLAMLMNDQQVDESQVKTLGMKALTLIKRHDLYQYLDTKKDQKDYQDLLDHDFTELNEACFKKTTDMYFIYEELGNYHLSNLETSHWLSSKGIAIMFRYTDDLSYFNELKEHLSIETLPKANNLVSMLAKDDTCPHIKEIIALINAMMKLEIKAYQYRLMGLEMIKKADLNVYDECDLSNQMAYGLMTASQMNLLNIGKQRLDEIHQLLLGESVSEEQALLLAKIESNMGAYYQGRFKITKELEDIKRAISFHKQALQRRLALHSPTVANSYLTLASDYFHEYNKTHDLTHLRESLEEHLRAYEALNDDEAAYKNLIRIAGTKIMLCLEDYDETMVSSLYDDLSRSLVVALAHSDYPELRNIRENFKESLDLFKSHPCSSEMYDKIYHLARQMDREDGYYEDLVRRKL